MSDVPQEPDKSSKDAKRLRFDYIKSNFFRVIHADGFVGGINGRLDLRVSVWNERPAIPKQITHEITEEGLGREILTERVVRSAVVREVEADMVMSYDVAKSFHHWLGTKIRQMEKILDIDDEADGPGRDMGDEADTPKGKEGMA